MFHDSRILIKSHLHSSGEAEQNDIFAHNLNSDTVLKSLRPEYYWIFIVTHLG